VYVYRHDGSVTARGTLSAANVGTASCPGVSGNGANNVLYAPLVRPDGDPQIGSLRFYDYSILSG
jgi:hypothetical protein